MPRPSLAFALGFFLFPLLVSAQDHVAGRVVSAADDHPIPHARVTLVDTATQRLAATVFTDETGRFRFDSVPVAKYRLTGSDAGYTTASYLAHGQYSTAIVTGAGLPVDALELRLAPTSTIAGTVLDATGDLVQHAMVQLYREDPSAPNRVVRNRSMQVEDDGSFSFDHLAPGRYFVSASGTPWYAVPAPLEPENVQMPYKAAVDPALDVAYPMVFYPHALDSAEATPIILRGGEQLHLNLQLQAEHALTLTLHLPPSEDGNQPGNARGNQQRAQRFPLLTRSVFGVDEPLNLVNDGMNNTRRITGIPPGRYNLQEIANGSAFPTASRPLDISTASLSMDMPAATDLATITAAIHTADATPLPSPLQLSLGSPQANRFGSNRVSDKGVADFQNIPSGDYSFTLNGARRLYVTRLTVNGKVSPDKHLHVTGPGAIPVDMTVSSTEVQVDGIATREGKPVAASMAVLVPAGADTDPDLFRRDQTDLDGSFTFAGVIPGNYILIAIDDAWEVPWTDIPTLRPYLDHGVPVTIPATGPTHIKLPEPIPTQPR